MINEYNPRSVEHTALKGATVSTVLLSDGSCFETLAFENDDKGKEMVCLQTKDRAQALGNHSLVCACVILKSPMPDNVYVK